jgi:hypothetical protein
MAIIRLSKIISDSLIGVYFYRIFNYLPEQKSYTMLYIPSHTRSTPYFVGIFAAYVYRYLKLDKPKFRFPYSKTLLTILIAVYPLFLMTIQVFYVREYNLWLSVIYMFMYRITFAIIVSIFIIICAINGLFKGIKSHSLRKFFI